MSLVCSARPVFVLLLSAALGPVASAAEIGGAPADAPAVSRVSFVDLFASAAVERDVPQDLLLAIAYAENRWDDHGGLPAIDNGYGLMHLTENDRATTLLDAARLLHLPPQLLRTDRAANVAGGAAVLREMADEAGLSAADRADLDAWYPVVARYSQAGDPAIAAEYADQVYTFLANGICAETPEGETVTVVARDVAPRKGIYEGLVREGAPDVAYAGEGLLEALSSDYAPAYWTASPNYRTANRPYDYAVDRVVIHDTEGSYAGAISWFQNPSSQVSAHYVIRSSDGQITQMVREHDVAWHVACWNNRSIGIEHEGYMSQRGWYTDPMYRASAALTRAICNRYGIPKDRTHVVGHSEVSSLTGCTNHADPGPYWDWTYYMNLVAARSYTSTVDNATAGRFTASASWGLSSYTASRYGADYRYATPQPVSDAAWFKVNVPATGTYEVYAWWPANAGYSSATPFVIATSSGSKVVTKDQRASGGQWNSLGIYTLTAGDRNLVAVSRWSGVSGHVIADAVRIVAR